jgi:UDP-N-acetylglucosamine 2-epimerase (non-hydrolysing)
VSAKRRRVLAVVGTRPEAVKMAPVIAELRRAVWADVVVLATAQHRDILDQVLKPFGIEPDLDLNVMQPNQTLASLTARLMVGLDDVLGRLCPDAVLAQGDTTTVMSCSLASFYHRVPFGHIEAGLRTGNLYNPFPEEANRMIAGCLARWHFAPTAGARTNLLRSGVDSKDIFISGNTVIDALLETARAQPELPFLVPDEARLILITAHRRESFGAPFKDICAALATLASNNPNDVFVYPVHPNPNVREVVYERLGQIRNMRVCDPLDYRSFVAAMQRAHLVITDSGGVQEEAPALGRPVLVLRNETERPEAVEFGVAQLVGTDFTTIVSTAQRLLDDPTVWRTMARGVSPYGDGFAAQRIVSRMAVDLCPDSIETFPQEFSPEAV